MLLVSVVGFNYLNAFAAFRNMEGQMCIDPLISPLSLLHVPSNPLENTLKLARFLQCMAKLVEELESYYRRRLSNADQLFNQNDNGFPYFNEDGKLK